MHFSTEKSTQLFQTYNSSNFVCHIVFLKNSSDNFEAIIQQDIQSDIHFCFLKHIPSEYSLIITYNTLATGYNKQL